MAVGPSDDDIFKPVSMCVEDVARWFLENGLLLNPAKTDAVLFGTLVQRDKITTANGIAGTVVSFRDGDSVKLLGVTLGSALMMDRHVTGNPGKMQQKMPPTDKWPRGLNATMLVFHWTNLQSCINYVEPQP